MRICLLCLIAVSLYSCSLNEENQRSYIISQSQVEDITDETINNEVE
jgi:hypothetical protein